MRSSDIKRYKARTNKSAEIDNAALSAQVDMLHKIRVLEKETQRLREMVECARKTLKTLGQWSRQNKFYYEEDIVDTALTELSRMENNSPEGRKE